MYSEVFSPYPLETSRKPSFALEGRLVSLPALRNQWSKWVLRGVGDSVAYERGQSLLGRRRTYQRGLFVSIFGLLLIFITLDKEEIHHLVQR